MFEKIKALWPAITAFAMSGVIVAKACGYLPNLSEVQAETLIMTAGTVLMGLAARSGFSANANANLVNAASSAAASAASTAAVVQNQALALQDASRAVVAAAVAQPTAEVIAAAGVAAEVVTQVVAEAKTSAEVR